MDPGSPPPDARRLPVWRVETAPRAAVLVDVADYYEALAAAIAQARRSIHLLNWNFESRTRLTPGRESPADERLGETLRRLARGGLDIRILCWRAALPVALGQNGFPQRNLAGFAASRVRFVLDGTHP